MSSYQHPAREPKAPHLRVGLSGTTEVITVADEVDLATAPGLTAVVSDVIDRADETVVLDLGEARFLDTAALHAIVAVNAHANAKGVRLVIVPAQPHVQRLFTLTGTEQDLPFVVEQQEQGLLQETNPSR